MLSQPYTRGGDQRASLAAACLRLQSRTRALTHHEHCSALYAQCGRTIKATIPHPADNDLSRPRGGAGERGEVIAAGHLSALGEI